MQRISKDLGERLYAQAGAARWSLSLEHFTDALQVSVDRMFADRAASARDVERYLRGLHLPDLALARACMAGNERAWEHFIREHRPVLYRAADALDPSGGAREIADSIYGDLFGAEERDGERRSLLRYFHGRSSLATWLRAVLAQRHVDSIRARRRLDPLPEDDSPSIGFSADPPVDPDRDRYLALLHNALAHAITALTPRDRLRLASYYSQRLTLAQIGRITGEHEATVSRQLARTRRVIRDEVQRRLRAEARLDEAQVQSCFEYAIEDPGMLDLRDIIRKQTESDRSI